MAIRGHKQQLNAKDNTPKLLSRIEELKEEEKALNIKIADLEGRLYLGRRIYKNQS